jgi:RNA polymerase sigma factor for flagellar operon FliA
MKPVPSLSDPENQRLIKVHTPLVENLARKMVQGMPANVECDDLVQDGMLGLIDAILRTSKVTTGAEFQSYVAKRARGAMIDGLRASDPASRMVRKNMRQVESVLQRLGHSLGRVPLESEVADALCMQIGDYQHVLQEAHGYTLISIDDLVDENDDHHFLAQCADTNSDPFVVLERSALRQALAQAIFRLPEQDRQLLHLYYEEGLKMREVGQWMALTEARVSQLHAQAIAKLRASFTDDNAPPTILKPRRQPRQAD